MLTHKMSITERLADGHLSNSEREREREREGPALRVLCHATRKCHERFLTQCHVRRGGRGGRVCCGEAQDMAGSWEGGS